MKASPNVGAGWLQFDRVDKGEQHRSVRAVEPFQHSWLTDAQRDGWSGRDYTSVLARITGAVPPPCSA